ncbi:conjugal transfer protein TraF [candidate division KSB1 bacterium]|nr:conjugal transfer protein TraF [candidate division KSB1 bacterium]
MRRIPLMIIILLIMLSCSMSLLAQNERYVMRSPRAMGMGGAGLAVLSPDHVFFYNPAQLNRLTRNKFTLVDARICFNKNLLDQLDFYNKYSEQIKNLNDFSDDETSAFFDEASEIIKKRVIAEFAGPVPINLVVRNFGVGFFTGAAVDYRMKTGASSIPLVNAAFQADFLVVGSLAHGFSGPFPGKLSVGGTVKYMNRWISYKMQSVTDLDNQLVVFSGKTIGVDLATLYSIKRLAFGFTIFDVNSPTIAYQANQSSLNDSTSIVVAPNGKVEPSLRCGLAYYPKKSLIPIFSRNVIALDIEQPFDGDLTFFKKLYFGFEGTLASVFRLRVGFAQGYASFGAGIDLSVILIDYAFYGQEWGGYAGQVPNWNHLIRFKLGF